MDKFEEGLQTLTSMNFMKREWLTFMGEMMFGKIMRRR